MRNAISVSLIKGEIITRHSKQIARDRKTDKALQTVKTYINTSIEYINKLENDIKKRDRIIKQQMRLITKLHKMLKDREIK